MTARIRIAVAIAILIAVAAHPLAHPMVKECPCTHAVGVAALERSESFVLQLLSEVVPVSGCPVREPETTARTSRAPPAV
ncbi:MAG TPA: hypothetical protein VM779_06630 [Thermoanaerobaculia bacterium]|nr:hypothetical protein [Thermoanaerobaculia bacterium]